MHGKEQVLEKPFAVLEKCIREPENNEMIGDEVNLNTTANQTILDTTVAIDHKSRPTTEYRVRAIVRKKLIFKTRPKPIISNVAKTV